jgi:uncharacterized membrane protein (DUF2068 family)
MDWSLYRCGRTGHVTYAPDEAELRGQMRARTGSGDLWQCLRCGDFVPGEPDDSGPAADAPEVPRDREIRGDLILKLFACERAVRVIVFGTVAYGVWRFRADRLTFTQAVDKEIPIIRSLFSQLGFTVNHTLVDKLQDLLHVSQSKLTLIALGITALAVVSAVEAFALWQAKRWGEYFAMIVTSLGLPVEVYELTNSITATKAVLFALNLLLVVYLVYSRRLFGARGGKAAYDARLRADSVIDEARKAAAASQSSDSGSAAASASPNASGGTGSSAPVGVTVTAGHHNSSNAQPPADPDRTGHQGRRPADPSS